MSDHLVEACQILDGIRIHEPEAIETSPMLAAALLGRAQVHATLEVAEHVEYAGEQLRRLADAVEQVVEVLRVGLDVPDTAPPPQVYPGCARCGHPSVQHVNRGACLSGYCGCLSWRPRETEPAPVVEDRTGCADCGRPAAAHPATGCDEWVDPDGVDET